MIFDDNWQRQSVGFQSFIHIMLLNAIVAQIHCERFNRMFEHTKPKIFEIENVLYLDGRKWAHPRVLQQRKYGEKRTWMVYSNLYVCHNGISLLRLSPSLPCSFNSMEINLYTHSEFLYTFILNRWYLCGRKLSICNLLRRIDMI